MRAKQSTSAATSQPPANSSQVDIARRFGASRALGSNPGRAIAFSSYQKPIMMQIRTTESRATNNNSNKCCCAAIAGFYINHPRTNFTISNAGRNFPPPCTICTRRSPGPEEPESRAVEYHNARRNTAPGHSGIQMDVGSRYVGPGIRRAEIRKPISVSPPRGPK